MKTIAILCSDLHFSSVPPVARSSEPSWFDAMKRQIDELKRVQEKHHCPIIVAGDVFDRWRETPELVNFLIDNLPQMPTFS